MRRGVVFLVLWAALWSSSAASAQTQEPLFDTFNFKLEGSWVGLTTKIRLDSERLGRGTTLSFENDLGLPAKKIVPSLSFEWRNIDSLADDSLDAKITLDINDLSLYVRIRW